MDPRIREDDKSAGAPFDKLRDRVTEALARHSRVGGNPEIQAAKNGSAEFTNEVQHYDKGLVKKKIATVKHKRRKSVCFFFRVIPWQMLFFALSLLPWRNLFF